MTIVEASAEDKAALQKIGETAVLPAWVERCGARCGEIYNAARRAYLGREVRRQLTASSRHVGGVFARCRSSLAPRFLLRFGSCGACVCS